MTDAEKVKMENELAELRAQRYHARRRTESLKKSHTEAFQREADLAAENSPESQRKIEDIRAEMKKIQKLTGDAERRFAALDRAALVIAGELDRAARWPILVRQFRELWILQPEPRPSLAQLAVELVSGLPADGFDAFPGGAEYAEISLLKARKNHRII